MKIYELISHRSYEIDPKKIDFKKTKECGSIFDEGFYEYLGSKKWHGNYICLKDKTKLVVSKSTWEKVVNGTKRKS